MLVVVGMAGSGKSTQSQLLTASGAYRWVSIGEILRREASQQELTEMQAGKMLNDDRVISYLKAELNRIGDKPEVIIDGFPRSVYQADWLLKSGFNLRAVVHIIANRDVVMDRLINRGRPDDHNSAITERFKEYDETIRPIIEDLQKNGVKVVEINGNKAPLDVFMELNKRLEQTHVYES